MNYFSFRSLICPLLFLLQWQSTHSKNSGKSEKTNFLFIIYDDLRPELSIYGKDYIISPNFERLAKKSVTFDYALCQIAVCNPSRDSLMTGLRPDTVGTYGFQFSFRPNTAFPSLLVNAGYKTAGYGKVLHWDGPDRSVWTDEQFDADWYKYQGDEWGWMNSSTMPDKVQREEDFRDHLYTTKAIDQLKKFSQSDDYFMVGVGYKLPHLQVHIPFKYFDMYRDKQEAFKRPKKDLHYPISSPPVSYKCCAHHTFMHMTDEGARMSDNTVRLPGAPDFAFTQQMHTELMWGYAAAVTFLDAQIGRLMDTIDELQLWNNLTVILTSDHGMHNGEKGMWEKWTLFDESTRVPLMISHPQSPFQGQRYSHPVELIDIFPTVLDLLHVVPDVPCPNIRGQGQCRPLAGKSLAPAVMGTAINSDVAASAIYSKRLHHPPMRSVKNSQNKRRSLSVGGNHAKKPVFFADESGGGLLVNKPKDNHNKHQHQHDNHGKKNVVATAMPVLGRKFAVSQDWRCAFKDKLKRQQDMMNDPGQKRSMPNPWFECNRADKDNVDLQLSVMGYSFRSLEYRYTIWLHFDREKNIPMFGAPPYAEELYDHRNEVVSNFTHLEYHNLVNKPQFSRVASNLKLWALQFLQNSVTYMGPYPDK